MQCNQGQTFVELATAYIVLGVNHFIFIVFTLQAVLYLQQDDIALADVDVVHLALQQPVVDVPDQAGLGQRSAQ